MRLDKLLWFLRLVKTRTLAQQLAAQGRIRIDGRPATSAHAEVRAGQVLSFAHHDRVRVLRILALPVRRGPAPEAQACYADLAPAGATPVDG